MPRYAQGTRLDYTPFDRKAVLDTVLGRLGSPLEPTQYQLAGELVRPCRTYYSTYSYAQELTFFLRWCRSEGIEPLAATEDDAYGYAAWINGYAIGTQGLKLNIARMWYERAKAHRLVEVNPFAAMRIPLRTPQTETPSLTKAQVERVLLAITSEFGHPDVGLTARRDYALITVMVRLCLRAGECASLRWGRFHETNGRMRMSFLGKGKKPAHLDLPADVWQTLQSWKRAYEKALGLVLGPNDPVFLPLSPHALREARERRGASPLAPIARRSLYGFVVGRLTDVGISGNRYSPHCLRATGAVLAYQAGVGLLAVQALLRHASPETTIRYLQRLVSGAATEAIDGIRLDVPAWVEPEDETDPPSASPPVPAR